MYKEERKYPDRLILEIAGRFTPNKHIFFSFRPSFDTTVVLHLLSTKISFVLQLYKNQIQK